MAYEPTVWKSGDVVTSAKLNNIEQGIANAGSDSLLLVTLTYDEDADDGTYISSATFAKIVEAYEAEKIVVVQDEADRKFFAKVLTILGITSISGLSFSIGNVLTATRWDMSESTNKWTPTEYTIAITQ